MVDALLPAFLAAARIGGVVATMPAIGIRQVPAPLKVLVAMVLTGIIWPWLPAMAAPLTLAGLAGGMTTELLVGIAIGGTVRLVFGALPLAGELAGSQLGHSAGALFDPLLELNESPLGVLCSLLATLCFLGADLHLTVLVTLARSFEAIPPGAPFSPGALGTAWTALAGRVLASGLALSAPLVVLVFLVNAFAAVVTRLAPSMNVFFSLGLVLTAAGGLLVYHLALPVLLEEEVRLVREVVAALPDLVQALGGR